MISTTVAALLALGAAMTTPAAAEPYRCTSRETGRSYIASQNVPGDKCALVKTHVSTVTTPSDFPPEFKAELAAAIQAAKTDAANRVRSDGLAIGMSPDAARASTWGRPRDIRRITTESGVWERWIYSGRKTLYFENSVLTAIAE
jgi:hypothetical protein